MFEEKDLSSGLASEAEGENSHCQSKISVEQGSEKHVEDPDEKMEACEDKGMDFLKETVKVSGDGVQSKSTTVRISSSQETPSRPDDPKLPEFLERVVSAKNLFEKMSYKGKEVVVSENTNPDGQWVERDFLSLSGGRGDSSKRAIEEEEEEDQEVEKHKDKDKKPKLETLNLSLGLLDVSLSLSASNLMKNNGDPPPPANQKPSTSIQSLVPSANNTRTTCSNDFTAASLSHSYSHQFSHNPSCSLTRNSTENFDYSISKDDHIWNCGEGTNGSVHSRFKPIGDGANWSNHGGGGLFSMMQSSVHCKTTNSDNHSFFPSELPARPRVESQPVDTKGTQSENLREIECVDVDKVRKISRPDRILREIISKSIPAMSKFIQDLPEEEVASVKDYLKDIIETPDKKDELVSLQKSLDRRSDLTKEAFTKLPREGMEILVSIKMGLASYLSGNVQISHVELSEVFFFIRCRNLNCKSALPFDDCDCKICSFNRGFCNSCMCPVCLNFDCANNTCSWVGCDVCSHWCHAACGIIKNLIRPGPSLKGPSGTSEMQFHCIGCGHASEMFGFVKDVFLFCAKDWGQETLMKELECVRRIFKGSEDYKGKELHNISDDILFKLQTKMTYPADACNVITQFFNYTCLNSVKEVVPQASYLSPKRAHYEVSYPRLQSDSMSKDLRSTMSEVNPRDEFRVVNLVEKGGFDSLETIVKIKEAEARMFEEKAEEARRAAEGFKKMIKTKMDKMEEDYVQKLSRLCLQETEDKRRKKLEELKVLENSHCDYYKMKIRMQAEIASLLERMEATKQKWV